MEIPAYSSAIGIVRICWIIFAIVWLLAATSTKRTIYRESAAERARYWIPLAIAYFLVVRSDIFPPPLDWFVIPHTKSIAWSGACLCICGLVFAIWARVILGRNWSGVVTLKEEHELIERGPYRIVRHPIYTGMLAMFAGTAIVIGYLGGFLGLLLAFASFWLKLKREEDLMLKHFPEKYAAYQVKVKRIIPFLV